ncbi:YbhB/YbcL family Raf kinase inhibitor-like protein [Candidatus Woesearchaeota archaeon]|nr:YbhB/YbcL family Raf kinase inhibitor-like protein [Candidatus Woesearchaeota archaeon]
MKLISSAFEHNGKIPSEYTCDGEGVSPELIIETVPENTRSLAIIMDDPDVPKHIREDGMWVHWVVWNINPDTKNIARATEPEGVGGNSNFGKTGYGGPCPPDREHRYFFKLYALDSSLELKEGSTKEELEEAMSGHILEKTELVGLYERTNT